MSSSIQKRVINDIINPKKRKREDSSLKEKIILDSNYMKIVYDFVTNDEYCNKYSDFLKSRIFQLGWYVSVKNKFVLKIFEYPILKSKLQNFLYNCRTFIRIFGFCIYYITNDIDKWMEKYSDLDDQDKNNYKLPFGFININDVDVYLERENNKFEPVLKVYPKSPGLKNKYNFYIYYHDFKEDSLRMNSSSYSDYNKPNYSFINSNYSSGIATIRPFSKFTILRERKLRLIEATNSRDNANFMSCHPETWVVPDEPKDIPLENLSEGNLYTFDDLEDAQSNTNKRFSRVLLQYAKDNLKKIQNNSYPTSNNDSNNRDKIKKLFNHVDLKDGMMVVPTESSKIYKTHDPKSLIDIQIENDDYNEFVASIYKLPKSIFSIQDIKKNQRLNPSTQNSYVKLIEKEIEYEQKLINDIFIDIYGNSFSSFEQYIKQKNDEQTALIFKQSKIINDEKLVILIQLYERQLISDQKIKEIIEQWI